jgi:DNA-binding MarR family transcriptional regulator
MYELAYDLVLSRSGLTRLVDRLEQQGLLRRDRSGPDRRATYAVLTLKGVRAFRRAWPIYAQGIARYFVRYLTDEELCTLTEYSTALKRVGIESGLCIVLHLQRTDFPFPRR